MEASKEGEVFDVIVTSATGDKEIASRLQTQLKDASITVSVSTGEVPQKLMIDAKALIFIASEYSISDEVYHDCLSLADLTNMHITVVSTKEKDELLQECEAGRKSSFNKLNWTVLDCDDKLDTVIKTIKDIISQRVKGAYKSSSRPSIKRFRTSTKKDLRKATKKVGQDKAQSADQNIVGSDLVDSPDLMPQGTPCTTICEQNPQKSIQLREVVTDIIETAPKWRDLGIQLCIPKDKLHSIHRPDAVVAQQCLGSVIDFWIDNIATDDVVEDKQTLIAALRSPAVGSNGLAHELGEESFDLSNAELVCKLAPVESQWHEFGHQLGIPIWKLDSFYPSQNLKANNNQYLTNMLDIWRKGVYSPPAKLVPALRAIGMRKLASKLAPKYEGIEEIVD